MDQNKASFSRQAVIILVVAGLIILWDSFSWGKGRMNGMWSILAAALTLLLLGSMYVGRTANNPPQSKNGAPPSSETHPPSDAGGTTGEQTDLQDKSKKQPRYLQ